MKRILTGYWMSVMAAVLLMMLFAISHEWLPGWLFDIFSVATVALVGVAVYYLLQKFRR